MDLEATVEGLCGFRDRSAGTEAERRAAGWLRDRLRAAGRDAAFEVHWVRPHWSTIHLLGAGAGVAGSLLATAWAIAGLAVVAVALASTLLELTGRPSPNLERHLVTLHPHFDLPLELQEPEAADSPS